MTEENVPEYPAVLANVVSDALYEADDDDITAEIDPSPHGRVGQVTVGTQGASVTINEESKPSIDEALAPYGWECSTIRLTWDGLAISVWQRDR